MPNPNKNDQGLWEATHKDGSVTQHASRGEARDALRGIIPAAPEAQPALNTGENLAPAPEHLIGGDIPGTTEAPAPKAAKTKKTEEPKTKLVKEPAVAPNRLEGLEGPALTSALLKLATTKLAGAEQELHKAQNMTVSQVEVLLAIGKEPVTQRYLTQQLDCTGGNITLVLDNLQKKGLVDRERKPEDRRAMNVTLTKKGADLAKVFSKDRESATHNFFSGIEEKDVKSLNRLLKKLVVTDGE